MSKRLLLVALLIGLLLVPSPSATPQSTSGTKYPVASRTSKNSEVRIVFVEEHTFEVSAYSAPCPIQGTGMYTRNHTRVVDRHGRKVLGCAADPRIIPIRPPGKELYVKIQGKMVPVDDTGGGIHNYHLDFRVKDRRSAIQFGKQRLKVRIYRREVVHGRRR